MKRRAIWVGVLVALGVLVILGIGPVFHYQLTGKFFPIHILEELSEPHRIVAWEGDSLLLVDGRRIQVPDFEELPEQSRVLEEVTRLGVDIDGNGRCIGLLRIHHWCGNDPVGKHLSRIDISDLLTYVGEGERLAAPSDVVQGFLLDRDEWGFSEYGWNISEYLGFRSAQQMLDYERMHEPLGGNVASRSVAP